MTNTITIDLPDDPEEAVRRLRNELRAARRRLDLARQHAGLAFYRSAVTGAPADGRH